MLTVFCLVIIAGGSMAKYLCSGLPGRETDWSKWQVFFCDERHVPYTDPECTYSIYKSKLVDNGGPLPEKNIFPINPNISGIIRLQNETYDHWRGNYFHFDSHH
jgi:6-phosphogluconolactonase/glucosamine-6-phosphate isomerase/deaminase